MGGAKLILNGKELGLPMPIQEARASLERFLSKRLKLPYAGSRQINGKKEFVSYGSLSFKEKKPKFNGASISSDADRIEVRTASVRLEAEIRRFLRDYKLQNEKQ
ncbi:MAG: hypothetical protein N3E51_02400 [Candidatus Micrarchaeota archaeon]|nr:hypothetical protein [Candidatus Micrarchaeota archaeon]